MTYFLHTSKMLKAFLGDGVFIKQFHYKKQSVNHFRFVAAILKHKIFWKCIFIWIFIIVHSRLESRFVLLLQQNLS